MKDSFLGLLLWLFCGMGVISADEPVDANSLHQKMLLGYQAWFAAPGDGSRVGGWHHWFREKEGELRPVFEMWPDMSELTEEEKFRTPLRLPDGRPAYVFSSHQEKTVRRHFKWMEEAGIDGILLQRFIGEAQDERFFTFRNAVTRHVMKGAEKHGRVFALEYDMAARQAEEVKKDWIYLVDELKITASPRYLRHKGRPLLGLWGIGFKHREGSAKEARELIAWFQKDAPEKYRATVLGGVPTHWRRGVGDSQAGEEWAAVYRSLDVLSPWTVGRYRTEAEADRFRQEFLLPDLAEANRHGFEYLPVVFPGFSWQNLHDGEFNQIPRLGGRFYWRQVHNAVASGATMIKTAMFDEVDEGTAMFKTVARTQDSPAGFLALDADGESLPSDWYLRLSGACSRLLRGEIPLSTKLPIKP
ncbi:MAG: glycoside hydrolase family 71/99-like protein [Verrucomicrobiales bacterium]